MEIIKINKHNDFFSYRPKCHYCNQSNDTKLRIVYHYHKCKNCGKDLDYKESFISKLKGVLSKEKGIKI